MAFKMTQQPYGCGRTSNVIKYSKHLFSSIFIL